MINTHKPTLYFCLPVSDYKPKSHAFDVYIKTQRQLLWIGMLGSRGVFIAGVWFLSPAEHQMPVSGASGYTVYFKRRVFSGFLGSASLNHNVCSICKCEMTHCDRLAPKRRSTLSVPRHSCGNVYIMMNEYTMTRALYIWGVICIVYFLVTVSQIEGSMPCHLQKYFTNTTKWIIQHTISMNEAHWEGRIYIHSLPKRCSTDVRDNVLYLYATYEARSSLAQSAREEMNKSTTSRTLTATSRLQEADVHEQETHKLFFYAD